MYATDPSTSQRLQPAFIPARPEEVELAVRRAAESFPVYRRISGRDRAAFLREAARTNETNRDWESRSFIFAKCFYGWEVVVVDERHRDSSHHESL
jgi:hypothetical protein